MVRQGVTRVIIKVKNPQPKDKCTVVHSDLLLQSGCTEHEWRWRGQECRGLGDRGIAVRWKHGASGKQNKSILPSEGFSEDTVSL